jgi:hypothetical protein
MYFLWGGAKETVTAMMTAWEISFALRDHPGESGPQVALEQWMADAMSVFAPLMFPREPLGLRKTLFVCACTGRRVTIGKKSKRSSFFAWTVTPGVVEDTM